MRIEEKSPMNTVIGRGMRLAVMTVGFAGLLIAVNAVPGAATPQVPLNSFHSEVKARGALADGSLEVNSGRDIVVTMNTVDFPGSSGWHSHPGGAIVVVTKGQITTYRSVTRDDEEGDGNARCAINVYNVGDAFIERPGEPLNAVNTDPAGGKTIVWATFPGVPAGTSARTDVSPNPGTCPGV
jgi:hypothetical protein